MFDGLLLFLALEGVFYAVALLGLNLSFDTPTAIYLACNLLWALLAALLAGYLTARIAHHAAVAHGIALAIILIPLCVFNLYKGLGSRRTPFVIALNVLAPLLCIGGAWLYSRSHRGQRVWHQKPQS